MKKVVLFTTCICAWAQSGWNRPQIGQMLDGQGSVRTVYGIASSVSLGDAEMGGVLSYGCSKTLCLWKTATSVVSPAGTADAPEGPAMFAFDGAGAFVWFPPSRRLARWENDSLTYIDINIEGEVLSIGVKSGAVFFAVRRRGAVWIVNQDGSVAGALGRGTGAVMLVPGGVVYVERGEAVVGNARFPLEGVSAFFQMSDDYLQVRARGVDYALRITLGREALFQLPGVSQ
ncbi:MAG TPA: hypothetical protein VMT15_10520 [Bryobacteraceae bacterium]|nr:hypothetical protein [Bryobacteraceae bacterium]